MSLLNPYDDFSPSEEGFWSEVADLLLGVGTAVWMLPLSPIGLVVSVAAWGLWGDFYFGLIAIVGGATMLIGVILGLISLMRFLIFERKKETTSKLTERLFVVAGVSWIISSVSGLAAIGYCISRVSCSS